MHLSTPQIVTNINDIDLNKNNINLRVFPNPANEFVNIEFFAPRDMKNLNADIFSISGKKLNSIYFGNIKSGLNNLKIDLIDNNGKKLYTGIYYLSVYSGDFKQNIKLIVE